MNASLDGTDVIYHRDINIGIAVALDWGLMVPVIRKADEKNVLGLQRAVNDLADRARKKQLKPDEIQQRHLLDLELRQLRQPLRHPGHQSAASGDSRLGRGDENARRDRRRHRDPLDILCRR